jgi:hypothetical protein
VPFYRGRAAVFVALALVQFYPPVHSHPWNGMRLLFRNDSPSGFRAIHIGSIVGVAPVAPYEQVPLDIGLGRGLQHVFQMNTFIRDING